MDRSAGINAIITAFACIAVLSMVALSLFSQACFLRSDAAATKSYNGLIARQSSTWGLYTVKVCEQGIRIDTQSEASLIAAPPDWTIYVFRKGKKRAAKIPYEKFRTKNLHAVKLSSIKEKPLTKLVAGVKAIQFNFKINHRLEDTTMGGLYMSQEHRPLVILKEVVFAPDMPGVPKKAKGVWSNFFEIPIYEEIPMQIILHLSNGETRAYFNTKSIGSGKVTDAELTVPAGLEYTAQFAEIIFGKETEGVADLLYR